MRRVCWIAPHESPISHARDAIRNSDRGEGGAKFKSLFSNARNAVRNRDGGEGAAFIESLLSNASNTIGNAVVGNGCRDSSGGETRVIIRET